MNRFQQALKNSRKTRGLTQSELGRSVGVTRGYINMMERGAVPPPSRELIARLEEALGLPVGDLQVLACLDRVPAAWLGKLSATLRDDVPVDEHELRGTDQLLDLISGQLNAAWKLPDEKRRLADQIGVLRTHRSPAVRRLAFGILGRLAWSESTGDLLEALDDPDVTVRQEAAHLITERDTPPAVAVLERALGDREESVRQAAVESAARRPAEAMLDVLARFAREERNADLRRTALAGIARLSSTRSETVLTALAREGDPELAAQAREALDRSTASLDADAPAEQLDRLRRMMRAVEQSNASPVELRVIPLISATAAGDPAQFTDGDHPAGFADEYVQVSTDVSDANAFGLRVRGDSMVPVFREGDVVIVSPNTPPAQGLRVVAKIRDGEVTCKTLTALDDERVTLASENPAYPRMVLDRAEVVWVYPVVRSIRNELPM